MGVIFDDQLTFKDHIAKTARSCRFALLNIRKIRPFLTEHAAQLLVQVLVISRLDYCNALLAGLPSCTIKPLLMIQNAVARLVFSKSWSPKEPMLHLSLSSCTGYRLRLASSSRHWCLHIEQPQAQHPPTSTITRSTIRLKITFQNILVHHSWLVEWSSHPYPESWIPDNFQAKAKNSSLLMLLDFILNVRVYIYIYKNFVFIYLFPF